MLNITEIKKFAEEFNYTISKYGIEPNTLIVGEATHLIEKESIEKLIELIQPKYLLHELLGVNIFNGQTNTLSLEGKYAICKLDDIQSLLESDLKYLKRWAMNYNLIVVGCDLSWVEKDAIGKRLFGQDKSIYQLLASNKTEEEAYNNMRTAGAISLPLNPFREVRMGKKIIEYNNSAPIITILGNSHVVASSMIHPTLKRGNINYITLTEQL